MEVAQRLARGESYKVIAEGLFISVETVKTHANRIYAKTGCRNNMELLMRLS